MKDTFHSTKTVIINETSFASNVSSIVYKTNAHTNTAPTRIMIIVSSN